MPLTITVAQLSEAVRLTVSGSPAPPYLAILTRQLAVAAAHIEEYAPDAPDAVANEAARLIVGHLLDAPPGRTPQSSFSHSGAKALLAPWHLVGYEKVT